MTPDDYIYSIILIISIPLAYCVKLIKTQSKRKWFILGVGLLLTLVTSRLNSFHHLILFLVNYVICTRIDPRTCHICSFIWCFSYLAFFRLCPVLGFPDTGSFSNAIQLFLTLKMVGMAMEVNEGKLAFVCETMPDDSMTDFARRGTSHTIPNESKLEDISVSEEPCGPPGFIDILSYAFCFIGLFAGPHYTFRTYQDMIEVDYHTFVPRFKMMLLRMALLPVLAIIYLGLGSVYKLEDILSGHFYKKNNFFHRFLYMVAIFTIFRARLYMAWIASESACMLSCLGIYPTETLPSNLDGPIRAQFDSWMTKSEDRKRHSDYDFETVRCFKLHGCEISSSARVALKSWNMTVQTWLASNIHRRTKYLESSSQRALVTMFVSAYWHGFHPGYYLSFMIVPFCIMTENIWILMFSRTIWAANVTSIYIFHLLLWFIKMRMFDYMCMGFLLKSFWDTISYWGSIYFCCHIFIFLTLMIGYTKEGNTSRSIFKSRSF